MMADAMVERTPPARFFCHRCLVEFRDVAQNCTCPYCESGFIEELEADAEAPIAQPRDNYSDADMSNINDMNVGNMRSDGSAQPNTHRRPPPVLNDIAFLMSGARMRTTIPRVANRQRTRSATVEVVGAVPAPASGNPPGNPTPGHGPSLIEELLLMISGGRPPAGMMTAGMPFVLVGTPGDYVFGGEGLDAIVNQLIGQMEHSGPPPMPRERLAALPTEQVSEEMAGANIACSVCWDNFQLGETISRLECDHVFHQSCITPWLELHATCPICRRSLMTATAPGAEPATTPSSTTATTAATNATTAPSSTTFTAPRFVEPQIQLGRGQQSGLFVNATPRIVIQRRSSPVTTFMRRTASPTQTWDYWSNIITSSNTSPTPSMTTGGAWVTPNSSSNSSGSTNSSSSLNSNDRDRQYNTDIDYD